MFDIGGPELIMILIGVLVLFGPKKLPELAQGLGKGLRQFRRAQQEFNDQITSAMREEERKKNDEWKRPIEPKTVARNAEPRQTPGTAIGGDRNDADELPENQLPENRIAPPPPPPADGTTDQTDQKTDQTDRSNDAETNQ